MSPSYVEKADLPSAIDPKFRLFIEAAPDAMVIVDSAGRMVMINCLTEKLFGFSRNELLGNRVEMLVPERLRTVHVGHRARYLHDPKTHRMGKGQVLTGRRKNGTEFSLEISLSPLETEQGVLIISMIRDITDRRQAEEHLQSLLREKETLLKEIHHRVKNNLQITSSLLKMQSHCISDFRTRELFEESQNRIQAMALVHEKLYGARDFFQIDFSEYMESLAELLFRSFSIDESKIRLKSRKTPVFFGVETAVPSGLIVNELISNCLKHAFPQGRSGEISVSTEKTHRDEVLIRIKDDGVGLPKDFDFKKTESFGLQLVRTLVSQLNGQMQVKNTQGAEVVITFLETKGAV